MKARTEKQKETQAHVLTSLRDETNQRLWRIEKAAKQEDGTLLLTLESGGTLTVEIVFDGPRTLKHVFRVIDNRDDSFGNFGSSFWAFKEVDALSSLKKS